MFLHPLAFGWLRRNLGQDNRTTVPGKKPQNLPDLIAGHLALSLVGEPEILYAQLARRPVNAYLQGRFAN
jgi:hypothetical protein